MEDPKSGISSDLMKFLQEQYQMTQHTMSACTKLSADMEWLFGQLQQATLQPFAEGLIVALRLNPEQAETVRLAATAPLINLSPDAYKTFIEKYIERLEEEEKAAAEAVANERTDNLAAQGVKFD